MSAELSIPEAAIDAGAEALEVSDAPGHDVSAWFRAHAEATIQAAAPLVVAAELASYATDLRAQADAFGYPCLGTPASGMVTVLNGIADDLDARAAELRGVRKAEQR